MSGGSYEYTYVKIDMMADDITLNGSCSAAPPALRAAFKEHLRKVARACKAIEWNDSCDGDDNETELLTEIVSKREFVETAIDRASEARDELQAAIKAAEEFKTWQT